MCLNPPVPNALFDNESSVVIDFTVMHELAAKDLMPEQPETCTSEEA